MATTVASRIVAAGETAGITRIHAAADTTNPDATFIAQVARNLTDTVDGFLRNIRYLVIDRDSKFTADFARTLEDAGVAVVRTAFQAPNMNALAERWVLSVKTECLDRMILFGQGHLERVLREYTAHYNAERPHQGIGNEPLDGAPPKGDGDIVLRERLGGLLNSYHRAA